METLSTARNVHITLIDGETFCYPEAQVIHESGFVMVHVPDGTVVHINAGLISLITFTDAE